MPRNDFLTTIKAKQAEAKQAQEQAARRPSDATPPEPEPAKLPPTGEELDAELDAARAELLELQRQEVYEARQRLQANRDRDASQPPQRRMLFAGQRRKPYWR